MVANFNRPPFNPNNSSKTLDNYDFSWLGRGYTISVKQHEAVDQRDTSSVSAVILKDGEKVGYEYEVRVTNHEGRTITSPKDLTDELVLKAFDELKGRFEKVAKAEKYLGTYPKISPTPTPRPPVMRNSEGSVRP